MKTVIEMAREAGFPCIGDRPIIACGQEELERFAELVRSDEREAVLDLVDSYAKNSKDLAAAIRSRGNT